MSEDYISLDIKPSYLKEFIDLAEEAIIKSDCFEDIERLFYMRDEVEKEYHRASNKLNEDYDKHRESQRSIQMLRQYIEEIERPPLFISKDEDYIDKYYEFKKKMEEWGFCELFSLFLVWEGRVTKEKAKEYIGNFEAWKYEKE